MGKSEKWAAFKQNWSKESTNEALSSKEVFSFGLTEMGRGMIMGPFGYFTFYITQFVVMGGREEKWEFAAIFGVVILFLKIWDGINDILMGGIADITRTRWGKCKPYAMFTPIPFAICVIVCLLPIRLSITWAIVFATFTHLIYDFVYTLNDIGYWAMSATLSTTPSERTKAIRAARFFGMIGGFFTGVLFLPIKDIVRHATDSEQMGYFLPAIVMVSIGAIVCTMTMKHVKERTEYSSEKVNYLGNIKLLFKNKPLIMIVMASMLSQVVGIGGSLGYYFSIWNYRATVEANAVLNDLTILGIRFSTEAILGQFLGIMGLIPAFIGFAFAPWAIKKFGTKNIVIFAAFYGAAMGFLRYFVIGYTNLWLMLFFGFLSNIPGTFNSVAHTAMLGNTVDYLEVKTGQRTEGLTFGILTFINKIGQGISQGGALVLIAIIGIDLTLDPNADKGLRQTKAVEDGIWWWICISPAFGGIVSGIIFLFYKFDDKEHAKALKIIAERKATAEGGGGGGGEASPSEA